MWENKHHKRMADRSVGREHLIKAFKRHRKLHHEKERLHREFHEKVNELFIEERDIQRYHRRIKYSRPMIMLFNLILWFVLFHYFGIKGLSIIFAIIISVTGVTEFIFLMNLEKRIFKPISRLRAGVEEISKGNYDVTVEYGVPNEISVLTRSFNEMAQKLKAAEQLKEQYEENRKNLVANISHDLKTPITTIHGYIETMLDREDISRENVNKYHRIIYNNATYINKLIDDLFLFSKLDMQKLELKLEHISMKAFMEDLMGEFKFELEDRGIGFEYIDEMTQDKFVNMDRKRINQILNNIIGNAIKYGREENTFIRVKLYEKNNDACIDVKDNGVGIPDDKLPFIFERFYRVDYARTKDLMSTGLGLAISKELVEAHGGKITATSIENVGSCFTITLPGEVKLRDKEESYETNFNN